MQNFMAPHAIARELWPFKNWPFCPHCLKTKKDIELKFASLCSLLKALTACKKSISQRHQKEPKSGPKFCITANGKSISCSLFRSQAANNDSFLSVNSAQVSTPSG